jgi:hypothetical protein
MRWLRISLSLMSLTLSIFFICLWARSQACVDEFEGGFRADQRVSASTRRDGLQIHIQKLGKPTTPAWRWRYIPQDAQAFRSPTFPWELFAKRGAGFAYLSNSGSLHLRIPYWFLTLFCVMGAVVLAPKFRWRWSLRQMLAIVTCSSVLLGIVVALSKSCD